MKLNIKQSSKPTKIYKKQNKTNKTIKVQRKNERKKWTDGESNAEPWKLCNPLQQQVKID